MLVCVLFVYLRREVFKMSDSDKRSKLNQHELKNMQDIQREMANSSSEKQRERAVKYQQEIDNKKKN